MLKNNFIRIAHLNSLYRYRYSRKYNYLNSIYIRPFFLNINNFSIFYPNFGLFYVAYTFFIKYWFKKKLKLRFNPRLALILSHDFYFQSMLRRRKKFVIYTNKNKSMTKHFLFNRNKNRPLMSPNKTNEKPINFRNIKNINTKR